MLSVLTELPSCRAATPRLGKMRGEVPYLSNCAPCQGSDPNRLGALGPAMARSPRALIEERVLHRPYLVPTTPDVTPTEADALDADFWPDLSSAAVESSLVKSAISRRLRISRTSLLVFGKSLQLRGLSRRRNIRLYTARCRN
jgi:hypothetical protein